MNPWPIALAILGWGVVAVLVVLLLTVAVAVFVTAAQGIRRRARARRPGEISPEVRERVLNELLAAVSRTRTMTFMRGEQVVTLTVLGKIAADLTNPNTTSDTSTALAAEKGQTHDED